MSLRERFIQHLAQYPRVERAHTQLVAVSGGIDSVVLCDLLFAAGYDFVIAHCNYQLRGEESRRDEAFVRALGKKYGKVVLVQQFETEKIATQRKWSIQVAARELRYNWFHSLLEPAPDPSRYTSSDPEAIEEKITPFQYIVTAHHANDSIETLLMNFFKGTGIAGLHGILPIQGKIFRPLLFAKKEELLEYAEEQQLSFVEDSSNLTDKYTRNFFRHQLLPLLKQRFPNVEDNLINNIGRFTEIEDLYRQSILQHKKKLLEYKGNEIHIPVLKLKLATPVLTIVHEIVKDHGFTAHQLTDIMTLLDGETGKFVASGSHIIFRNRRWLIIAPKQHTEAANILITEEESKVCFEQGMLSFTAAAHLPGYQVPHQSAIAALDRDMMSYPLLLRKWKQGDYFYPLGMNKKKKLSRFLIDQKVSKTDKENTWVLEMNKRIIWIVGHRIDDRFKITPATKQILTISFTPAATL